MDPGLHNYRPTCGLLLRLFSKHDAQHIGLHRQQAVPHLQPAKGAAKLQW